MNKPVLNLKNITKTYAGVQPVEVLKGISLSLEESSIAALIGPSGSGKTTLLQIAGLLDQPCSGVIELLGESLGDADERICTAARSANIGFVYQFHHLLPEFTALENVMMPMLIAGISNSEANERAIELLASVGLADRIAHYPSELSGGEQQRVAIVRALANKPALLLADEPTGNLDEDTAAEVFALLMRVVKEQGVSALIATHNLDLAKQMDEIYRIDHGQVIKV